MFVKKLVEKISQKAGKSDGMESSNVEPRLVFHYGIPPRCNMCAYDSVLKILALSTEDGRIKLYGKENTQALLISDEIAPSKFLQFIRNEGVLINVTFKNHIEVWDIENKVLSHVHVSKEEITAFSVMQHGSFMYAGDSLGNLTVFKLDQKVIQIVRMNYTIPFMASHGNSNGVPSDKAIACVLPQPTAGSKRVLIIFRDGFIVLWEIPESKAVFRTGGNLLQSGYNEGKQVTSSCWTCASGTKIAVGYSNGEILIWSIPSSNSQNKIALESSIPSTPILKLNIGFKSEKVPILSLRWAYGDDKCSRLYVMGDSEVVSSNPLQVVLLNENSESRMNKLVLPLSEPCTDMEIVASMSEQNKNTHDFLFLIGKSGLVYMYDDCLIEKCLLQCQSRPTPSPPKEVMVKLPFVDSEITIAKLVSANSHVSGSEEDYLALAKDFPLLLPLETGYKEGTSSDNFTGFTKIKNLYITGHSDGAINFWDLSCPLPLQLFSLKQQSEDDFSLSGVAVTALYFSRKSLIFVSGDQSGTVRIFKFKPEPYATHNSFISLQGGAKRGSHHIIRSIKVIKVNGSVSSLKMNHSPGNLAVGSDQGYVSLYDMEGTNLLFEKYVASDVCTGIISMQFKACSLQTFEKNVLVVAAKDSSIVAFDRDTGNIMSSTTVRANKPSRVLFMQTFETLACGPSDPEKASSNTLFLLLCSEKATYVYSFIHAIQGVKKVHQKKKFHNHSCCWASTFTTPPSSNRLNLMLLFTSGRVEIRTLPELLLLKETAIRGFRYSESSICSSSGRDLVMAHGDQELLILSVFPDNRSFRLLDNFSQVYRKDNALSPECVVRVNTNQKEKKKAIFGSVLRDSKSSRAQHVPELEAEDTVESVEELATIFSTENFPGDGEKTAKLGVEGEKELDIDDINIDDTQEKSKGGSSLLFGTLNKQKLTSRLQSMTGRLKQMTIKNEKTASKEELQDERGIVVDQIKKRYGFSALSGEASAAKMAESKLQENVKQLQGISLRCTQMQETAETFSSTAKELLRNMEQEK